MSPRATPLPGDAAAPEAGSNEQSGVEAGAAPVGDGGVDRAGERDAPDAAALSGEAGDGAADVVAGDVPAGDLAATDATVADAPTAADACAPQCAPASARCTPDGRLQSCLTVSGCTTWGDPVGCTGGKTCRGSEPQAGCLCAPGSGAPCGSCGGTLQCDGQCSKPSTCQSGDGCCPPGCTGGDSDCNVAPVCGNSTIELGESCDPAAACLAQQSACVDDDDYTRARSGDPAACTFRCTSTARPCGPADGRCPQGCTNAQDSDCKKAGGAMCLLDVDCASGKCTDQRCCIQVCSGCYACTGAGGTCQPIAAGNPDDVPAGTCGGNSACDGAGSCRKKPGQGCSAGGECASGACSDGVCCNRSCGGRCETCTGGTCTPVTSGTDPDSCPTAKEGTCSAQGACQIVVAQQTMTGINQGSSSHRLAQTFTVTEAGLLSVVQLAATCIDGPGNISIQGTTATGAPSDTPLTTVYAATNRVDLGGGWFQVTFPTPVDVTPGDKLALVWERPFGEPTPCGWLAGPVGNSYDGGAAWGPDPGGAWQPLNHPSNFNDFKFKILLKLP